jgi:DeoR-like protein with HTH domain
MTTLAAVRHQRILDLVATQEYATVTEIRTATGASMATTHRDLALLSSTGYLVRVHGGAARRPTRPAPTLIAGWLSQACDALDRDDLAAVESALQEALSVLYRCSFVRQSSGTAPDGPGTPWSAG